ncbi:amidase family protein [Streptococcus hongkongensis]
MSKPLNNIQLQSCPLLIASLLLTGSFLIAPSVQAQEASNLSASKPSTTTVIAPESTTQMTSVAPVDPNSSTNVVTTALAISPQTDQSSLLGASSSGPMVGTSKTTSSPINTAQDASSEATLTISPTITLDDYQNASASQLSDWVRTNKVTGDQLLTFALDTIKATNTDLNNVISLREAAAHQESAAMLDNGQPFYKVPILVKGLGHTIAGGQNTNGLAFLSDQTSKGTSSFVKALQSAGFVVLGQSSFPEMGWINVTNSGLYGVTHNPWNTAYNPGGSSGGSAAGVAAGQVPVASASDGGGSTRIPASWTGLIGLHPSRGILEGNSAASTNNVSHFALTKSIEDTQKLFEALLKNQAKASQTSQHLSKDIPIAYTTQTPAGTPISDEAIQAVKEAVAFLNKEGFKTVEVNYPVDGKKMMEAYYTIAAKGALSIDFMANQKLKRHLQKDDVELLSWALYQTGKDLSKADLDAAWATIGQMTDQLNAFYQTYPIFLTPTTSYAAPSADYHHIPDNLKPILADMSSYSKEEKLNLIYRQWLPAWTLTPFTQLANLTGTPSLSLPTHLTKDGMPLGILFNSAANQDRILLELGKLFESNGLFQTIWSHKKAEPDLKEINSAKADAPLAPVVQELTSAEFKPAATRIHLTNPLANAYQAPSVYTLPESKKAQLAKALPNLGDYGQHITPSLAIASLGLALSMLFVTKKTKQN